MVIAFPDFDFVSLREPIFDSLRLDRYRAELGIADLCGDIQSPFQKFAALAEARRVTPHRDCDPIKFDSYVHALASLLLLTSGSGRSRANKSPPAHPRRAMPVGSPFWGGDSPAPYPSDCPRLPASNALPRTASPAFRLVRFAWGCLDKDHCLAPDPFRTLFCLE